MEIFMSGEIDSSVSDLFGEVCNEIEQKLKVLETNDYGTEVESIGIIPIIVNLSPDLEDAGFFKERKLFSKKKKDADYRLRIDYAKFVNADREIKKLLILKNVITCIRLLSEKATKDFDAKRLENDIFMLFEVAKEKIDAI